MYFYRSDKNSEVARRHLREVRRVAPGTSDAANGGVSENGTAEGGAEKPRGKR